MICNFGISLIVVLATTVPSFAQNHKPPREFRNTFDMKFVWIPPGFFIMGSPKEEEGREWFDLMPELNAGFPIGTHVENQHKVTLTKGFYMGVHVVTQELWTEIMGKNPSHFKGEKNLPVETVSWGDCQDFLEKLRKKDGRPYRLPTEAEWEYSCRAGTTTPFHFGKTISADQANYDGTQTYGQGKKGANRKKTTPVDSFPANAFGLYDVHGNVVQWCQDWLGPYPQKDVVDPQGPNDGKWRVARGGSWMSDPGGCRSALHRGGDPNWRFKFVGFRVCFNLSDSETIEPARK
jgi:formylglycine-generating enzyme